MLPPPPPSTNNSDYSFSVLTPTEQNALLWQHNRWLLDQLARAENTVGVLQAEQTALTKLAHKNDFYGRFMGDGNRHKDFTIRELNRLKELYRSNPAIADLAVDELVDSVKDMGKGLRAEVKQRLDITD